jgi:hypothetical protein
LLLHNNDQDNALEDLMARAGASWDLALLRPCHSTTIPQGGSAQLTCGEDGTCFQIFFGG